MRAIGIAVLLVVAAVAGGCTSTDPPISLADRFEIVAFEPQEAGIFQDRLFRWERPIRVRIIGSQNYRDQVASQLAQISELIGAPLEMESGRPNMTIEFSTRDRDWFCYFDLIGQPHHYVAEVYIATDQHSHHIRRCISQELSQAMGLVGDTDGRRDTTFSSAIGTDYLTEADLALFEILYDRRLRAGMHRDEAMPIVRQIVSEMEQQEAGR